jgi:UDP-N-acetylglucosamine transferase subunit ALG13
VNAVVFVAVGTDHHDFSRLVSWVERWAATEHPVPVRVVVQHGTSRAPVGLESFGFLGRTELDTFLDQADIIVTQGGPGSITDARQRGIRPIVVPRRVELHEMVDNHQVAFGTYLHEAGEVLLAQSEEQLADYLNQALVDPGFVRVPATVDASAPAVAAFAEQVEQVLAAPWAGFLSFSRLRHMMRRSGHSKAARTYGADTPPPSAS